VVKETKLSIKQLKSNLAKKRTGYLVKERDIDAIAGYMKEYCYNEKLVKSMGTNARKHIIENFNIITQTKKLIEIYRNYF